MAKNKKYLEWVRQQPCVITGRHPVEAHHLIGHNQGGMGMKSSDYFAIPLAPEIHRELHDHGYKTWEGKYGSQWKFVSQTLRQAVLEGIS